MEGIRGPSILFFFTEKEVVVQQDPHESFLFLLCQLDVMLIYITVAKQGQIEI